jgi:hypothetical protein
MWSIDIDNKNLAWVFLFCDKNYKKEKNIIEFCRVNLDEGIEQDDSIIIHQCQKLYEFFSDMDDRFPNIRTLIVEKQFKI